jgi:hypothetical protein
MRQKPELCCLIASDSLNPAVLLFLFSNLGSHSLSQRAGRERDEAKKLDKSSSWRIEVI